LVSLPKGNVTALRRTPGKGSRSIAGLGAIKEINLPGHFPGPLQDISNYWCYIQVRMRYWRSDWSHMPLLL
jgi:hypothetical protein